jgi:leucyl-tRNA synthetase
VYNIDFAEKADIKARKLTHSLIKKVEKRLITSKFNTAVSAFMEFINETSKIQKSFSKDLIEKFLITLAPFAPHITEELWQNVLKNENSIFLESFPSYDEKLTIADEIKIAVQVNGKLRATFQTPAGSDKQELEDKARNIHNINKYIGDKQIVKTIVVPGKIVNFVVK